jgi:hypothetical protein
VFKTGVPTEQDIERLLDFFERVSNQEKIDEKLPENSWGTPKTDVKN